MSNDQISSNSNNLSMANYRGKGIESTKYTDPNSRR